MESESEPMNDDDRQTIDGGNQQRETESMHQLRNKLMDKVNLANANHCDVIQKAKHRYYVSYFRETMERFPLGKTLLEFVNVEESEVGFLNCLDVAKVCINFEIKQKQFKAMNMAFNMVSNVLGNLVHTRYVQPYLSHFVNSESLANALVAYQAEINEEEGPNELQYVAYMIQTELEKAQPMRIPNPMTNIVSKQLNAFSRYVVTLLKSVTVDKAHDWVGIDETSPDEK